LNFKNDSSGEPMATAMVVPGQNAKMQQGLSAVPAPPEFKARAVRGGAATVLGQGVNMALQVGTMIILARLLSPTDYGLQAMVLTLTNFLSLFKDAGLSAASIQRENLTHEEISTLFWINVAVGTFLAILLASVAPLLADFYKEPRLLRITLASASIFVFNSLGVQHIALLNRTMRFGAWVKIDVSANVIGATVAIGMAALGFGYWSLICQNISIPIAAMTGSWIAMPWLPGRARWTPALRSMVRFGGTVTLNSIVTYVAYNTEKVLLGRFWGAASLGLYSRAYQLVSLPVQQLMGAVGAVAFPILSRMQTDAERLRRSYLKSHSVVVAITVPVVISCALFANEIVRILLGEKWIRVALILRLLSPTILVWALINPISWLLRSTGRVVRSLKIALLICPVVILGVVIGLSRGPAGVALGYSLAMVLLAVPAVAWAIHGTGITNRDYWDCIKRPLLAGAIAGVTAWLIQFFFKNALTSVPLLAIESIFFCAAYGGFLLFVMGQKDFYVDLAKHILNRREPSPVEA
jgi:O-antigen/teichoic acid export membrane protein